LNQQTRCTFAAYVKNMGIHQVRAHIRHPRTTPAPCEASPPWLLFNLPLPLFSRHEDGAQLICMDQLSSVCTIHNLPASFLWSVRILDCQRIRQPDIEFSQRRLTGITSNSLSGNMNTLSLPPLASRMLIS